MSELVYSRKRPTRVGLYWLKDKYAPKGEIVRVNYRGKELRLASIGHSSCPLRDILDDEGRQWAGPIAQPKEAPDAA